VGEAFDEEDFLFFGAGSRLVSDSGRNEHFGRKLPPCGSPSGFGAGLTQSLFIARSAATRVIHMLKKPVSRAVRTVASCNT
jgi:hypothetical protein